MKTSLLNFAHSGCASSIATTLSGSSPYFGQSSRSMSSCWFALSASRRLNEKSSISTSSSGVASRTVRRMVRMPNAAWRASSCFTRRMTSERSGLVEPFWIMSKMPTAMPSNRHCMPSVFIFHVGAASSLSRSTLSVPPIG